MTSSHAFNYDSDHDEDDEHFTYEGKDTSKLLFNKIVKLK